MLSGLLLLSACGNKETGCEDKASCKKALEYVTYENQGANDKIYRMEEDGYKSYNSLEEAKASIPDDYESVKDQKMEKYAVLEYELRKEKEYVYKFVFYDLRSNDKKVTSVHLIKDNGDFAVKRIYGNIPSEEVERDGKLVTPVTFYSKSLSEQEKQDLKPTPVKKDK